MKKKITVLTVSVAHLSNLMFLCLLLSKSAHASTLFENISAVAEQYIPTFCWAGGWSTQECEREQTQKFLEGFFNEAFSFKNNEGVVIYLDPSQMSKSEKQSRVLEACEQIIAYNQNQDYAELVCPDLVRD